jgi:hypothetical protein
MVLIVTPSSKVQESIPSIIEAIGESVHVAPSLRHAATLLRTGEYSVVVLDQLVLDSEPAESDTLMLHIGTAIPLCVNFGITGTQRFLGELKSALQRRNKEIASAKSAAEQSLRKEWSGKVTAMLLSCEMALEAPELPLVAETKLRDVYQLAQELKGRLTESMSATQ